MKLRVNNIELKNALAIADKGTSTNTINGDGELLFFKVSNNTLQIKAQSELSILTSIKVDNLTEDFEFCINGKLFFEFVKKCENDITLSRTDNTLKLSSGKIKSTFAIMDREFPNEPNSKDNKVISLNITSEEFSYNTQAVMCAVANDEVRPILKGINISYNTSDNLINIVSIDGLRLAKSTITADTSQCTENFNITLFAKHIKIVNSIIAQGEIENFAIEIINNNNITFVMDNTKVYCGLMNGDFIPYERIIPKNKDKRITVNTMELSKAIQTILLVSKNLQANLVRLAYNSNNINLSAKSEFSSCDIDIECITTNSMTDGFKLAFNSQFLLDSLKNIKGDEVTILFTSSTEPMSIIFENLYYLILPVRVMN